MTEEDRLNSLEVRVGVQESELKTIKEDIGRFRAHIGDLLTFKSNWEGSMKAMMWMLGFVGLEGAIVIARLFLR